jgi:nucleoside-diphosphate-sugar epimerase
VKILVTGGAGYIGSILVPRLLAAGHAVTVLDNFRYRQTSLLDCCADPRLSIVRGDCRDEATLRPLAAAADAIVPLAALVGAPACDADRTAAATTNLDAVRTLLALRSPSQPLVFPCTNSGYGVGQEDRFCTEETPLRPLSLYGRTKVDAERAVLEAGGVSLRLATVFGVSPRMRLDLLVNDFVHRAVTDRFLVLFEGHFKRNYLHVRDAADAFVHALDRFDAMGGQCYNVGRSDANLSKRELCERIQRHVPAFSFVEAPVGKDPDQRNYVVSNEKIERTGYRAARSLDDGIVELLKAYAVVRGDPSMSNA